MKKDKKDIVNEVFNKAFDRAKAIGVSEDKKRVIQAINELIGFNDDTGLNENEGAIQSLLKLRDFVQSNHKYLTHKTL